MSPKRTEFNTGISEDNAPFLLIRPLRIVPFNHCNEADHRPAKNFTDHSFKLTHFQYQFKFQTKIIFEKLKKNTCRRTKISVKKANYWNQLYYYDI